MEQVTPITLTNGNKDNRRAFRKMGFALFILTAIWVVGQTIALNALSIFAPHLMENDIIYYLAAYTPLYFIALPVYALLMRRVPKAAPQSHALGFGKTIGVFTICIFVMYVGNFIGLALMNYISTATGIDAQNGLNEMLSDTNPYVTFVLVAIGAPIVEELIFRKILIDRVSRYGEGIAVIMSGLLFGLYHMNFYQFFYAFFLGIVFAYVYVRTGRIRYSIGYHMAINILGGVVAPYIVENVDLDAISNLNLAGEAAMEQLMQMLPSLLLYLGYVLFMLLMAFIGFIVLIVFAASGKLRFRAREIVIPRGRKLSTVYLNIWTILLIAFCLFMFASNILVYA